MLFRSHLLFTHFFFIFFFSPQESLTLLPEQSYVGEPFSSSSFPPWEENFSPRLAFSKLKILPALFLNYFETIASYQDRTILKAIFLSLGYYYILQ